MTYKYTILAIPPSNNKFIGKTNWREYQSTKKQWALLIKGCCKPVPEAPLNKAKVTLHYFFPDYRNRDYDNYSGKMVLDGLVKARIIADDSFKHIVQLQLRAEVDKNRPRLEITVKEVEQGGLPCNEEKTT